MFRKHLKSSVKENNELVRRLVNDPKFLSGESRILQTLADASKHGLEFLRSLQRLTNFMNERGSNLSISEISGAELVRLLDLIDDTISKAST